jgi:hypothetical protein
MKTYVITISAVFPKTHARAGQPTDFAEKFGDTGYHLDVNFNEFEIVTYTTSEK